MSNVNPHLRMYGARGVPKGRVEAQIRGYGNTPCLLRDDFQSSGRTTLLKEHFLPPTFSDHSRRSNDRGNDVSECT